MSAPAAPKAPSPEQCCGRGCSPCIFDYYDDAFAAWESSVRALGLSPEDVLSALGEIRARRPAPAKWL